MVLTRISRYSNFRAYLYLIGMKIREMWEWRAEFIGDFIRIPITISMHLLIFYFIFQDSVQIEGFTRDMGISYIIIVSMIANGFSAGHMSRIINEHIVEGDLIEILVKPVNTHFMYFSYQFAYRIFMIFLYILAYAIATFFYPQLLVPQWYLVLYSIILIFLGFFISLQFYYLTGLLAFWLGSVSFINRVLIALQQLLGGRYFPISWLPTFLVVLTSYLPFAILFNIPALIIIGKLSIFESLRFLGIALIWLASLQFMIEYLFKKGLHRFDAAGD